MAGRLDVKLVEKITDLQVVTRLMSVCICACAISLLLWYQERIRTLRACSYALLVVPKVKNCNNYETRKERKQERHQQPWDHSLTLSPETSHLSCYVVHRKKPPALDPHLVLYLSSVCHVHVYLAGLVPTMPCILIVVYPRINSYRLIETPWRTNTCPL